LKTPGLTPPARLVNGRPPGLLKAGPIHSQRPQSKIGGTGWLKVRVYTGFSAAAGSLSSNLLIFLTLLSLLEMNLFRK